MCELATKLQKELLGTVNSFDYNEDNCNVKNMLLDPTLAIFRLLRPTECSLWSINRNTTEDETIVEEKVRTSTSLICRKVDPNYDFTEREDFAHDLKSGFFSRITESANEKSGYYYRYGREQVEGFGHRSIKFVKERNLNDFIVIPITDNEKIVALLEFSYDKEKIKNEEWGEIAPIICRFFSAVFNRYLIFQKQDLVDKLIKAHDKFRDISIESYFNHLITNVFRKFIDYQGASFFIWDSYHNRYNLITTTDKTVDTNTTEIFYTKDEGHTGRVGATGLPCITDSIRKDCKWYEIRKEDAETAMIIPIASPSNPKNVIGVVRFVNKKNVVDYTFIDFFNDIDMELMMFASKYLSLAVDFFLKEEEQSNSISKLAHEFKTPANAIFKSADRLLDHIEDKAFTSIYLTPYLINIRDFASSQIWQANSTLYLTRKRKRKYNMKKCSLFEVLKKSRDVARPIARDYNVKLSNIVIVPFDTTLSLNIDEAAFVIVFNNLLSNAIKYHNFQDPDSFYVSISCYKSKGVIKILVEDHGIGINVNEKESIFQVGFRGASAIKENSSGFGVGLSVVKQIVEDFGGTVSVINCKSPTTFEISFPNSLIVL